MVPINPTALLKDCQTAATNWNWDGPTLAKACATNYPETFTIDRGGARNVLWDVSYTWSYQLNQYKSWFL